MRHRGAQQHRGNVHTATSRQRWLAFGNWQAPKTPFCSTSGRPSRAGNVSRGDTRMWATDTCTRLRIQIVCPYQCCQCVLHSAGPVGQCQTAYQAYVATSTGAVAVNAQYTAMKTQCSTAAAAVGPVQNVSRLSRLSFCHCALFAGCCSFWEGNAFHPFQKRTLVFGMQPCDAALLSSVVSDPALCDFWSCQCCLSACRAHRRQRPAKSRRMPAPSIRRSTACPI